MSLSISGSTEDVDELMSCIINYDQLCKAEATEDTITRVKSSWYQLDSYAAVFCIQEKKSSI